MRRRGVAVEFLVGGKFVEQVGARFPLAGLRLLAAGQLQPVEQQLSELLRRAEIELVPDQPVDFLFEPHGALRKRARQPREDIAIDLDARMLHRDDDGNERPLERLVDRRHALRRETGLQSHPQACNVTSASSAAYSVALSRGIAANVFSDFFAPGAWPIACANVMQAWPRWRSASTSMP